MTLKISTEFQRSHPRRGRQSELG